MNHLYISNILKELPTIPPDSIVSRTIHNNEHVKITLFGFATGQELSEHTATVPAILEVLEGEATITIGDVPYSAQTGTLIYLPAKLEHSLIAKSQVVMLLYILKQIPRNK